MKPLLKEAAASKRSPSATRKLIAIGASAGGLKSLLRVLVALPADLPCAMVIATHLGARHKSVLSDLLSRRCSLRVVTACDGLLLRSTIYVAPPSVHVRVAGNRLLLVHAAPIRFLRPNIDLLFQSVAESFGTDAIAVILSGMGDDGTRGIQAVKKSGGVTLAEDSSSAEYPEMPSSAIRTGAVDWVLGSDTIGHKLVELCMEQITPLNG
jgi:two-component system, chemotaxis family, protein-glutamate methylesterase/glutaminase